MVDLTGTINRLEPQKVAVIGDLMLDAYIMGNVHRISPEAPVPVVNVKEEVFIPGGAGNVMLNLASLGAEVVAIGRVGSDAAGKEIIDYFHNNKVFSTGVIEQPLYNTPVKRRVIANNQQMIRIDHEKISVLPEDHEKQIIDALPELLEGVSAITISDYGKGFLTVNLLRALISWSRELCVPIIADPKGTDFSKYAGVTVLKPNLGEAYAAVGMGSDASLDAVAEKILETTQAELLMITRSADGISLFGPNGYSEHFPTQVREVNDVTGAGDTVLAMFTFALANRLPPSQATELCNIAAGIAVEELGCSLVSIGEIARRLMAFDQTNKVFGEEHLFTLKEALMLRNFVILSLSSEEGISTEMIQAIFQLSRSKDQELLVYIADNNPDQGFVKVLCSINEISFIVLKSKDLEHLCSVIHPDEVFVFSGRELTSLAATV